MKRILNYQTGAEKKLVRKTNMAKMFLFGIDTKVFKKKNSIYLKEFMQENQLLLFFVS